MALLRGPRQDQPRLRSFPLLGGGILGVLLGAGVVTAAVSFEHPLAPPASLSRADRSAAPPNVVDLPSRPSALLPTGCATLGLDEPNASSRDSMSVAGPRSTDPAAPRLLCAVDVPAGRTAPLDVGTIQPAGQELRLTVAPAHGVATRTGMTLLYTPAVGYAGPDRLVYETAAHGSGATTEVSFTVLPPPAALKLELPRGAAFGLRQTIPLSWTVQGDDADAPLLVRAQEPGTLDAMTGS